MGPHPPHTPLELAALLMVQIRKAAAPDPMLLAWTSLVVEIAWQFGRLTAPEENLPEELKDPPTAPPETPIHPEAGYG